MFAGFAQAAFALLPSNVEDDLDAAFPLALDLDAMAFAVSVGAALPLPLPLGIMATSPSGSP